MNNCKLANYTIIYATPSFMLVQRSGIVDLIYNFLSS